MNYTIEYSEKFKKKVVKFLKKHKFLEDKFYKTIELLEKDPFYPSLRLHKLNGKLDNYYSVSIDMQYRIILNFIIYENHLVLLDIGNHDEVY